MKKLRAVLTGKSFIKSFNKNVRLGRICKFDKKFYSQFDGMYFHGLPIYYHLSSVMSNGRCYDASAILGLAFGEGCCICRGDLNSQLNNWGEGMLGHGWVEKDGYVYDTTWKIICEKSIYEKVFKPVNVYRRESSKFFEDCKDMTDWTIHDKIWYEKNYSMDNLLIFQVREFANLALTNPNLEDNQRKYYKKLLQDLPDETNAKRENLKFDKNSTFSL